MNLRSYSIPYRLIAQSILYCTAGGLFVIALFLLAALISWESGWRAVLILVPVAETSLAVWSLLFLAGLFVLGLSGFGLAHPWLAENRPESVMIHSGKGDVTIPLTAIEEYLQHEAVRIPGVTHLRLRTGCLDDYLVFRVEAFVTDQVSIPGIIEELQDFMESECREVIGLKKIGPVHVTIKRICNDTRPVPLSMLTQQTSHEIERHSRSGIS